MSMAPYDQKNMLPKKQFHHRNGSDELDVFQATQYFAGEEKPSSVGNLRPINSSQKERGQPEFGIRRVGRMSLDLPINTRNSSITSSPNDDDDHDDHMMDKKQAKTPGRRLARFFSSLFNQTSSNQRKTTTKDSKLSTKQRRSSMSNFRSEPSHNHDSKSIYSSSSSETPSKRGYINNKDAIRRSNNSDQLATLPTTLPSKIIMPATSTIICGESKVFEYANWLDEMNLKVDYGNGLSEKKKQNQETLKPKFNKVEDNNLRDTVIDDGAESDSSSDLFELQNYDVLRVL